MKWGYKPRKLGAVPTAVILSFTAILIFVMFFTGEKEPYVTNSDDEINIKCQFGCSVSKENITSIELADGLPDGLWRSGGYGGISHLKGTFRSSEHGTGRLYVTKNNPPYIFISLDGSRDSFIYINLNSSSDTKELYARLEAWLREGADE